MQPMRQVATYLSISQNDQCVEDDSDIDADTSAQREDDDSDNSADDDEFSLDDSLSLLYLHGWI